jgi:hypothetical protein
LCPHILQGWDLVLINARHGIDLLKVGRLRWCLPLKLQQLLLEVGDHLHPLLKLGVLRLHVVLKVDDPVGTDIHLLTSDVEQHTGVVSSMLGVTKMTVNLLLLMV